MRSTAALACLSHLRETTCASYGSEACSDRFYPVEESLTVTLPVLVPMSLPSATKSIVGSGSRQRDVADGLTLRSASSIYHGAARGAEKQHLEIAVARERPPRSSIPSLPHSRVRRTCSPRLARYD
jgi:hypothetical protein